MISTQPDVSVCIVNWNCRDMLRDCLASLHERYQGVLVETIVVDNASTDGAADMVAVQFPEVILIRNDENRGFARGNNQAAARATGRYLFFLNNDTLVPERSLSKLLDFAQAHPEAGVIGPCLRGGDGQVQVSVRKRPTVAALLHHTMLFRWTNLFRRAYRAYRGRGQDLTTTHAVEVLLGAALFLRREVFAECGPWDERYTFGGEDIDLCTRIGRRYQAVYHPDVEITHFGRVSTRQHIGFAHSNTVNGITRFLRRSGTPRPALWLYKTALTLDAPLQWLRHGVNYLSQRLRGRSRQAAKSLLALRGAGHFLTRGLLGFWPA